MLTREYECRNKKKKTENGETKKTDKIAQSTNTLAITLFTYKRSMRQYVIEFVCPKHDR